MAIQGSAKAYRAFESPVVSVRYADGSVGEAPFADVRAAAFEGSVPWREVRSVHGQPHFSGSYASATTGGHVVYESRLELARLLLADFDPDVVGIFAQPFWLRARVADRVRRHVPDFLLFMRRGTVRVVNVKPADRLADPKVAAALAWPGALVERHGWEYEVWSGADPVLVENVRFLAGYRRVGVVGAADIDRAWYSVRDRDSLAVAERAVAVGRPRHVARPPLMALLWSGRLSTDLTRPLSGESILRRSA